MRLFGAFQKVEEQEDGTLKVSGIASSESEDSDGEVIKAQAMKAAIPDYMRFGAVREMHQPKAAGTALAIDVDDEGLTHFEALVVDSEAVKKVQTGVYKGFSIGGKVKGRDSKNKKVITELKLTEISLVDRPANPDAVITLVKFDGDLEDDMAKKKPEAEALPEQPAEEVKKAEGAPEPEEKPAEEQAAEQKPEEGAEKGEKPEGLEKAGAKFSKASREALADLHKMAGDMCEKFDKLGYKQDADDVEAADKAELSEAISKAAGLADELAKAQASLSKVEAEKAELAEKLAKAEGERDQLHTESRKLLAKLQEKGVVKLVPVSKEDDGKLHKAEKAEPASPLEAIKQVHAAGGTPVFNRAR